MVARDFKSLVGEFFPPHYPARRANGGWMGETRAPSGRTENRVDWQG